MAILERAGYSETGAVLSAGGYFETGAVLAAGGYSERAPTLLSQHVLFHVFLCKGMFPQQSAPSAFTPAA